MSPVDRDIWKRLGFRLEMERTKVMKPHAASWCVNCFRILQSSMGPSMVRTIYCVFAIRNKEDLYHGGDTYIGDDRVGNHLDVDLFEDLLLQCDVLRFGELELIFRVDQ